MRYYFKKTTLLNNKVTFFYSDLVKVGFEYETHSSNGTSSESIVTINETIIDGESNESFELCQLITEEEFLIGNVK